MLTNPMLASTYGSEDDWGLLPLTLAASRTAARVIDRGGGVDGGGVGGGGGGSSGGGGGVGGGVGGGGGR